MILATSKLYKNYRQAQHSLSILSDINIEIKEKEKVAIVGPSGTGKTTLLSLLAGLESPTSGEILFKGESLHQMKSKNITQYRAKEVGIVFQQFHLMSHLNAFENVLLPLEINNISNAKEKAISLLKRVGLEKRLDHRPNQLSGGECQRVAIARAFVHAPSIIFADEPTGNLDQKTSVNVMDILFGLLDEHKMTLVMVTHNKELASKCDRTLVINAGQVQ